MTTARAAEEAEVLAVLEDSGAAAAAAVTGTAAAIAKLTGGQVREVKLAAVGEQEAAARVLRELRLPGTAAVVLAGHGAARPRWEHIAQRADKPVILVPAGVRDTTPRIDLVLLPLDGTAQSAAAVAASVGRLARAGVELVVLHVFDAATVPKFWDQHAHAGAAWEQEFLARYCAQPGARLELRRGAAAEHVLDVAGAEQADLIALAWSRRLEPGRAVVVRHVIQNATVPVLLVPLVPLGTE